MRVLQVAHSVYPLAQAGTEIYADELARALSTAGAEVRLAVPSYALGRTPPEAVARLGDYVRPIPMSPGGWWGNKLRAMSFRGPLWRAELRRLVREFRPDIVHVHHPVGFGLAVLGLLAAEGLPLVLTLPDYWLLCEGVLRRCGGNAWRCACSCAPPAPRTLPGRLRAYCAVSLRRQRVLRFVHRHRPTLAAISESTRQAFLQAGFPPDLLTTHRWGIDEAPFRQSAPAGHGRRSGPLRVGYLGSVRHHKGCHVLLDAFTRLGREAELHFHGAGNEEYEATLRSAARGRAVSFHGRFDHSDVPRILSQVDLVVVPSVWEETYCLVFQEAMAARKPVIASSVGGLADRVIDGVNGFLTPPGDVEALTTKLGWVLDNYTEVQAGMDYDRCRVTIEDDCQGWLEIYDATIRRYAGGLRHPEFPDGGTGLSQAGDEHAKLAG